MATSQSHRLRRAAQKASRRKAVVAEKRKTETATRGGGQAQVAVATRAPVKACIVSDRLFAEGIGQLVLARTLPSGMVAASFFLLDVWCLGVKDAFFAVMTPQKFGDRKDELSRQQPFTDIDPSIARKLVHDAAIYAAGLGLASSEDFAQAEAIFGDIPMAIETFPFGKNGKPFFISGPHDSPTRIRHVLDTLAKRAGPDGFDFIAGMADFA